MRIEDNYPTTGRPFRRKRGDEGMGNDRWNFDEDQLLAEARRIGALAPIERNFRLLGGTGGFVERAQGLLVQLAHAGFKVVPITDDDPIARRREPIMQHTVHLEPGRLYQLGRKALAVEEREDGPVLVVLAEAPA